MNYPKSSSISRLLVFRVLLLKGVLVWTYACCIIDLLGTASRDLLYWQAKDAYFVAARQKFQGYHISSTNSSFSNAIAFIETAKKKSTCVTIELSQERGCIRSVLFMIDRSCRFPADCHVPTALGRSSHSQLCCFGTFDTHC